MAITLDLIVLIDRLLTTLRHRYELLELTSLRLQWDDLRWRAVHESRRISRDLQRGVREHGLWAETSTADAEHATVTRASLAGTPRRDMHLPLLKTQLRNLGSRCNTMQSTFVKRAGATLDKMIDRAGALKGLGGINGSDDEAEEVAGAVPERLLDIQDELELDASELEGAIKQGRAVQEQWQR